MKSVFRSFCRPASYLTTLVSHSSATSRTHTHTHNTHPLLASPVSCCQPSRVDTNRSPGARPGLPTEVLAHRWEIKDPVRNNGGPHLAGRGSLSTRMQRHTCPRCQSLSGDGPARTYFLSAFTCLSVSVSLVNNVRVRLFPSS